MPSYTKASAMRSQMDSQITFFTDIAHKSAGAMRQFSELQFHTTQQLIEASVNAGRALLACHDPYQFTATAITQAQPFVEHVSNYQEQLLRLLSGVQIDLRRSTETILPTLAQASRSAMAASEELARGGAAFGDAFARQVAGSAMPNGHADNGTRASDSVLHG